MYVVVYTDKGEQVWADAEVTSTDILFADIQVPNRRGSSFFSGLRRAIRDAEEIEAGRDPERPSEKAMRLAQEARDA